MPNNKLNFIFWGTPDMARDTLQVLKEQGYTPSLIITNPDKPQGRKMVMTPSPVKSWAIENNIPYIQPEKLDSLFTEQLYELYKLYNFQLSVVVAYGKIIPKEILNMPQLGSINIHYSLLPKYRGASPVESAILNGDSETGVTIQKMAFELDSGDILAQEKIQIDQDETTPELKNKLMDIGANLLIKILPDFINGKIKSIVQNHSDATFCKKIKKEDGLIDIKDDPIKNYNKYRAYVVWPRTYFFENNKRQIITKARLEEGRFIIEKIIPEGGKEKPYINP